MLAALAAELGADAVVPGVNCMGRFPAAARPPLPTGKQQTRASCAHRTVSQLSFNWLVYNLLWLLQGL